MDRPNRISATRKPEKIGFDFFYVMPVRCSCCGAYFQLSNAELWKNRCADCALELYRDSGEATTEV